MAEAAGVADAADIAVNVSPTNAPDEQKPATTAPATTENKTEDAAALKDMQAQAEKTIDVEIPIPPKHSFRVFFRNISVRNVMPFGGSESNVYVEFTVGKPRERTAKYVDKYSVVFVLKVALCV